MFTDWLLSKPVDTQILFVMFLCVMWFCLWLVFKEYTKEGKDAELYRSNKRRSNGKVKRR